MSGRDLALYEQEHRYITRQTGWDDLGAGPILTAFETLETTEQAAA